MRGCPDCKMEEDLTDLLVTNGMTRRKARALAKQIVRMFASENRKEEG